MATAPQPDRTELKLVRQGEAHQIARMSRDLVEHGLPWTWTTRRVAAHIRGRDSNVLGAWYEERLVGFAIMQFYAERAHLNLLAVQPAVRRLGIGRRLVAWQEQVARAGGIPVVNLEVRANNPGAQAFYCGLGYRRVERLPGYYQGREVALRMRHELRACSGRPRAHAGRDGASILLVSMTPPRCSH